MIITGAELAIAPEGVFGFTEPRFRFARRARYQPQFHLPGQDGGQFLQGLTVLLREIRPRLHVGDYR